jgi:ribose transport system permease protein
MKRSQLRDLWIGVVLLVLIIGFSIASPYFLTQANWLNTTSTATEVLLLAVGETFVICTGGIDLSVGAVLGFSGMAGAWVMAHWFAVTSGPDLLSVSVGFAAAVLAGGAFGAVNGLLVSRTRIPPLVVTLGTLGIATGLGNLLDNGQEISNIPGSVTTFGNTNLGGWVPVPVLIAAVITLGGARQDPVRRLHAEHRRQQGVSDQGRHQRPQAPVQGLPDLRPARRGSRRPGDGPPRRRQSHVGL